MKVQLCHFTLSPCFSSKYPTKYNSIIYTGLGAQQSTGHHTPEPQYDSIENEQGKMECFNRKSSLKVSLHDLNITN